MREEFFKERSAKLEKHAELTEKRRDKRGKKKERQKQLRNKHKLLKKLGKEGEISSSDEEAEPTLIPSHPVNQPSALPTKPETLEPES